MFAPAAPDLHVQVELFKGQLEAAGVRVVTDCRLNYTPGWKYNPWELRWGV